MTEEEFIKSLAEAIAKASTKSEVREAIKKADSTLEQSNFSKSAKAAVFEHAIQAAQDNSSTMANSGEAQEIVNQILNEK